MNTDLKQIANRIAGLREIFGKDTAYMAKLCNVSEEEYQKAERGEIDFSFTFLQKIASEFDVEFVELVTGQTPTLSGFEITKAGEGVPLERRKGFKYLNKAGLFKDKLAEPFVVTAKYDLNLSSGEIPVATHRGEEFNFILKGKLKVRFGDHTDVLSAGDSVYYNSSTPHGMVALDGDCEFLAIVIDREGKALEYDPSGSIEGTATAAKKQSDGMIYERFMDAETDNEGRLQSVSFHPNDSFNFAYDVVDAIAEQDPDKLAMLWVSREKEERRFSFGDMRHYSNKYANFFSSLGIKKGDRVMLVLKRHYEFWFSMLALHKLGAIAIPATNLLTKKDFEYRFNAAGVSAIVCTSDGDTAAECEKALDASPTLKVKILRGGQRDGWHSLQEAESFSDCFDRVDTFKDDIMLMYFTSGTTGYPKIAMQPFTYAIGHVVTARFWHNVKKDGLHFTISDTGWGKAVWGKLYGQWLCEAAIFTYDFDRFDSKDILPMFAKYQITTFCAPPTMYRFFIKEDLSVYDLSSLTYATIAGEALNPEVFDQFYKATGLKLMEGFGQTETTLAVANLIGMEPKPGSMGRPSPQYDIDIILPDGQSAKAGEVGEIAIRTDKERPTGMFLGYYMDPDKTKEAWDNGIYHTGDTAWRDEDGYFWYVGRVDDLIKSSGYRIGPFEIESVLMEIPYILECAVTGVPDEVRGQIVKATVVLVAGKMPSEELKKEIQEYVKEHTAPYKYPRIVEFAESLPKTISGKIRRVELR